LELRKLERTNLPILLLLTFQRLLPTIWTKQLKTKSFLVFTVINTTATLDTPCNAKGASPTSPRGMLISPATLCRAIIN
jgi:hypothetical protein